jgi:hypothetical protein
VADRLRAHKRAIVAGIGSVAYFRPLAPKESP